MREKNFVFCYGIRLNTNIPFATPTTCIVHKLPFLMTDSGICNCRKFPPRRNVIPNSVSDAIHHTADKIDEKKAVFIRSASTRF